LSIRPLERYPVGVIVERRKAKSQWIDHVWRPVTVLPGVPETAPWTKLSDEGELATFYAGAAEVELYTSDTGQYRDNLESENPSLWVTMRSTGTEPPYEIVSVTADTSEGEAMTETGADIVEPVPMPDEITDALARFITLHHVERVFFKRKRDRADPEALGQRPIVRGKYK
jgi:Protein of unknown function (DUF3305)